MLKDKIIFYIVLVVVFILLLISWWYFKSILLVILISLSLKCSLNPIKEWFEARGISSTQSAIYTFLLFVLIPSCLSFILLPELYAQINSINYHVMAQKLFILLTKLQKNLPFTISDISPKALDQFFRSILSTFLNFSFLGQVANFFFYLFLVLFMTFFLLKDGPYLFKKLIFIVPNSWFELVLLLSYKTNVQIGKYLKGLFYQTLIITILAMSAFKILNISYYLVLGLFIGLTNIVPFLGPLIGIIFSFIIVLSFYTISKALWCVFFLLIIQLIDNFIVQPMVYSRHTELHPLWILFLVFFGAKTGGIIGMIIIIPLASIIKTSLLEIYRYKSIEWAVEYEELT